MQSGDLAGIPSSAIVRIQQGNFTAANNTSQSFSYGAVNLDMCIVIVEQYSTNAVNDARFIYALTSVTSESATIMRNSGANGFTITYKVIEFDPRIVKSVQRFFSGSNNNGVVAIPIAAVDRDKSIVQINTWAGVGGAALNGLPVATGFQNPTSVYVFKTSGYSVRYDGYVIEYY